MPPPRLFVQAFGTAAFAKALKTPQAFPIVFDAPFVEADCFSRTNSVAVPARTFFSQLV